MFSMIFYKIFWAMIENMKNILIFFVLFVSV